MMDLLAFMESMGSSNIPVIAAFFIGLMTAISPCPAATNITAIAYISQRIDNNRHTLLVGFIYTMGRVTAYVSVAALIIWLGLSSQHISLFLQKHGERVLGPFLILLGALMLEIIPIRFLRGSKWLEGLKKRLGEAGFLGGFILGLIFALSFCPFSAVLFFGMLIPLALTTGDAIIIPSVFAVATGLPVILLSFLLTCGARKIGSIIDRMLAIQSGIKRLSSGVLIAVGIYYTYITFLQ